MRARILFQSTDQKHEKGENLKAKISDLENRFHKFNIQIIRISEEGKKRKLMRDTQYLTLLMTGECVSERKDWLLQNGNLHRVSGKSSEKIMC